MPRWFGRFVFCFCLLVGSAYAQSTSDALLSESEGQIESIRQQFKAIETVIGSPGTTDEQLAQQRTAIEAINLANIAYSKKIQGPLLEMQAQLSRLGPAPDPAQAEAPQIADQRRLLETRLSRVTASQKQLELLRLEADQSVSRILARQRDQFFGRIFRSEKSIFNPGLWLDAVSNLNIFTYRAGLLITEWWRQVKDGANFGGLLLLPAGLMFLLMFWKFIVQRLAARLASNQTKTPDESFQMTSMTRLLRVISGLVVGTVFILVAALLLIASFDAAGLLTPKIEQVLTSLVGFLGVVSFNFLLTHLVCAPQKPEARLVAVDEAAARSIPWLVAGASVAKGLNEALSGVSNVLNLPVNFTSGLTAIAVLALIAFLGILLIVFRRQADREMGEGKSYFLTWFVQLLPVMWLMLGISLLAMILGYISLGYFVVSNMLDTALLGILLAIAHYLADAVSGTLLNPASLVGQTFRASLGLSEVAMARISLLLRTGTDVVLFLVAIPALFAIWTVTWIDMSTMRNLFVGGFNIGNITLSPWGIIVAIAILVLGIAITRTITRWLQKRVLSETALDKGVQDSIRTASSYVGYIIACALALAAAGINLSSLAIVAGALGVGIGFGLQSIVNNFVSGLILLAERPIRVGDWVETEKGDGVVKKINVRSTEIETFDSSTVFIPNSTLISQSVKNWTHRDSVGRLSIAVMVDDSNNADKVAEILLEQLKQHPKILRYPEPGVLLVRFAPNRFEFEARGHVADVFEGPRVSSEIRFAIARAFDAKKIKYAAA